MVTAAGQDEARVIEKGVPSSGGERALGPLDTRQSGSNRSTGERLSEGEKHAGHPPQHHQGQLSRKTEKFLLHPY